MPLDAQDKIRLEIVDRYLEKAAKTAQSIPVRQSFRESGYLFTKAILEMCPDAEWREEILAKLREIAVLIATAPAAMPAAVEQAIPESAKGDPAD